MDIQYVDRATGKIEIEKIYGHRALSLLYGDSLASRFFSFFLLPLLARVPLFSKFYGYLQKRPSSIRKVTPFIDTYGVNASEFADAEFKSFNDFFIRKLKPQRRPIVQDQNCAVLPADARYLVFPDLSNVKQFYIKGQSFDLAPFLQDSAYAHRYAEGAMVIARLCPTDYHRFHFPTNGTPSPARVIAGPLFSVSPIALRKKLAILWENKRMVTEIDAGRFGTILYVEVGATCVGAIHQTYPPNAEISKGDEKGYFSFGGSCLVLLFEKGRIAFDPDLIENSAKGFETKALFGQSLGSL
jgi:phosphatidylserine decarboxylase